MKGYIYILTNKAFPRWVKIGRTVNDPRQRASELSSTGVPHSFVVAFSMKVTDCVKAEKWLHDKFSQYRVNQNREFFEVASQHVEEVFRDHISPGSVARRRAEAEAVRLKQSERARQEAERQRADRLAAENQRRQEAVEQARRQAERDSRISVKVFRSAFKSRHPAGPKWFWDLFPLLCGIGLILFVVAIQR